MVPGILPVQVHFSQLLNPEPPSRGDTAMWKYFLIPLLVILAGREASAQTTTLVIGYPSGASYDIYGRTFARHLSRHLPGNPTVVPQNMAGAGSLRAAN